MTKLFLIPVLFSSLSLASTSIEKEDAAFIGAPIAFGYFAGGISLVCFEEAKKACPLDRKFGLSGRVCILGVRSLLAVAGSGMLIAAGGAFLLPIDYRDNLKKTKRRTHFSWLCELLKLK